MEWKFRGVGRDGLRLEASINGREASVHRLPYVKTDCSGDFEVVNNSLAAATILLERAGRPAEKLETSSGAVLEMVG